MLNYQRVGVGWLIYFFSSSWSLMIIPNRLGRNSSIIFDVMISRQGFGTLPIWLWFVLKKKIKNSQNHHTQCLESKSGNGISHNITHS